MKSTLVTCSAIGDHDIQRDDENRVLVVDSRLIKFSPTQYRLLKPLVMSGSVPVADCDLVQIAFSSTMSADTRENLDKHLDKIRSKLRPYGIDACRVVNYGYVLLDVSG